MLACGFLLNFIAGVQAQTNAKVSISPFSSAQSQQSLSRVTFTPPNDEKLSGSRAGSSRRGGSTILTCAGDQSTSPYLTALLPPGQSGLTTQSNPIFFAYVPDTSAQELYFSLQDENGVEVYSTLLMNFQRDTVLGLQVPGPISLAMNQVYHWQVGLNCSGFQVDLPWAGGKIRRIAVDALPQLQGDGIQDNSLDMATLYGEAGIWYDTLTVLAHLQHSPTTQIDPEVLDANWHSLLESAELEAIAGKSTLLMVD